MVHGSIPSFPDGRGFRCALGKVYAVDVIVGPVTFFDHVEPLDRGGNGLEEQRAEHLARGGHICLFVELDPLGPEDMVFVACGGVYEVGVGRYLHPRVWVVAQLGLDDGAVVAERDLRKGDPCGDIVDVGFSITRCAAAVSATASARRRSMNRFMEVVFGPYGKYTQNRALKQ